MEHENNTPDAPRRGRPPNVAPVAEPELVTITLVKGYVPRGMKPDPSGTYRKKLPGTEISVPIKEAMYLCSHGIAKMDARNVDN
jgi:hypothetical protein